MLVNGVLSFDSALSNVFAVNAARGNPLEKTDKLGIDWKCRALAAMAVSPVSLLLVTLRARGGRGCPRSFNEFEKS